MLKIAQPPFMFVFGCELNIYYKLGVKELKE